MKNKERKRRVSVSAIEGAFPIRFPGKVVYVVANKQTKKKTKRRERCVLSHLFTRDGEHDRADAGRTSCAHGRILFSLV